MPGWSKRVTIIPGNGGYAYVPGELLIRGGSIEQLRLAAKLLGCEMEADDEGNDVCGRGWRRSGDRYWRVPNYTGDVPSAVRRLRSAGLVAQPNHVFFADSNNVHANPVYANPVYANPVYANPVYANPVYANPVYANPVYANPVYANPVYANPVYANPVYANPVYANPVYANAGGSACHCGAAPGAPCQCCADPCTEPVDPTGASLVYPNPVFARSVYSAKGGLEYELTGVRPSNAVPLFPAPPVSLPDNLPWSDPRAIRIAVLDTGWPLPQNQLDHIYGTDTVSANAPEDEAGSGDVPDLERDNHLDPVSGHGMFIANLILRHVPGASVRVINVLSTYGDGSEDTIANAIEGLFGSDPHPHIVSLSFGTYAPEEPERLSLAIQTAMANEAVVVASAGNDGVSDKQFPAAYEGVISVGALGPNGPAPFSNWGEWVTACAPGVDLPSGFWTFDGAADSEAGADRDKYEGWALWSGTSFAAPIVAAAIAQTMQRSPDAGGSPRFTANEAADLTVHHPGLHRLPCYGTVVNPPPAIPTL